MKRRKKQPQRRKQKPQLEQKLLELAQVQLQRALLQQLKKLIGKLARKQLEQKAERQQPHLPRRLQLLQKLQERAQLSLLLRQRAKQLQKPL